MITLKKTKKQELFPSVISLQNTKRKITFDCYETWLMLLVPQLLASRDVGVINFHIKRQFRSASHCYIWIYTSKWAAASQVLETGPVRKLLSSTAPNTDHKTQITTTALAVPYTDSTVFYPWLMILLSFIYTQLLFPTWWSSLICLWRWVIAISDLKLPTRDVLTWSFIHGNNLAMFFQ